MSVLERLKQIRKVDGNLSREQNQRYYELEKEIEKIEETNKQNVILFNTANERINKYEKFEHDVARYFDLDDFKTSLTEQEWEEYKELRKTIQKGVVK